MTAPGSKAAHTPGPWAVGRMLNPANARAIIGDGDTVVAIMPGEWDYCTYIAEDAHLIAAATELLAAAECEEVLRFPDRWSVLEQHGWNPRSDIAPSEFVRNLRRAAIAKATGGQP